MPSKWSFLRGLSYFFGNRDVFDDLSRLRQENYDFRERLLEKNRVRGLSQPEDKVEVVQPTPPEDYDGWRLRREAEILEETALPAARDDVAYEQLEFYASVDPEQWNPVLIEATRIRHEIVAGTYREPQER